MHTNKCYPPSSRLVGKYLLRFSFYSFNFVLVLCSISFGCAQYVVVVIQFLSGVFPLAEMAGFTPFLLQFLALRPSTYLVSEHPPSSNQLSLSPLPLLPVFFGRPRFLLPVTSRFRATLKTLSSSLLSTFF